MITERQISRFCWFGTIIGLISLIILSYNIGYENKDIIEITENDIGKPIETSGYVKNLYIGDHVFFDLENKSSINAVVFKDTAKEIGAYYLSENMSLTVKGKIEIYKNELEIIVNEIII